MAMGENNGARGRVLTGAIADIAGESKKTAARRVLGRKMEAVLG
jgi:hypothetical protein